MYKLQVYINPVSTNTLVEARVFYCHRAGGPYYRWCDEKGLDQWHFTRVSQYGWTPKELCRSSWAAMPAALKARVNAHYMS
jgi:hypothetical protein